MLNSLLETFEGETRISSSQVYHKFSPGKWTFKQNNEKQWILVVEELPKNGKKKPPTSYQVDHPLSEVTNFSAFKPKAPILRLDFKGYSLNFRSSSKELISKLYDTVRLLLLENLPQKLSRQVVTLNGLGGNSGHDSSMPSSSRSSSNSSTLRPTMMTHDETLKLLTEADESPVKSDFTTASESQNGKPLTNIRNPPLITRSKTSNSTASLITPEKSVKQSRGGPGRGSAVAMLLDKENENRSTTASAPRPSASTPNLNNEQQRSPLVDKAAAGVASERFYGSNLDHTFASRLVPGVINLPANRNNYLTTFARSNPPRISKRVRQELDIFSSSNNVDASKRMKRLNDENDALWKPFSATPSSTKPLLGFSNLGNTCYMNSILQSLFALDIFTRELWKTYTKLKDHVTEDSLLYSLPQLLKNKDSTSKTMKDDLLIRVKNAISVSATRFSGYSQHDAHEFLAQVLDQLKEEIRKLCDENNQTDLINPVENNFEFGVVHCIECQSCSNTVLKEERFNDLSLDLPSGSEDDEDRPTSLQKLIDAFFKTEQVTYKCEHCQSDLSVIRHNFVKLPRILILHAKRYTFDSKMNKNMKSTNTIVIPKYLSLSNHCNNNSLLYSKVTASTKKMRQFIDASPPRLVRSPRLNRLTPSATLTTSASSPILTVIGRHAANAATPERPLTNGQAASSPIAANSKAKRALYGPTVPSPSLDRTSPKKRYNFRSLEKSVNYYDGRLTPTNTSPFRASNNATPDEEADFQRALQNSLVEQKCDSNDDEFQNQIAEAMRLSMAAEEQSLLASTSINSTTSLSAETVIENLECEAANVDKSITAGLLTEAFRLCGIVTHLGISSSTGHYVCDVFDLRQNKWRSCDDSRVSDIQEHDVQKMRRGDGYIFFYVAKNILDDIANPDAADDLSDLESKSVKSKGKT